MSQPQSVAEAAKRALEDKSYAEAVLTGREDQPEVRQAILQDLATANNQDVQGFAAFTSAQQLTALNSYILSGPKPGGLSLANLARRLELKPW